MKKITFLFCITGILFYNCKKENSSTFESKRVNSLKKISSCPKSIVEISSSITTNTTWDSCHYYYVKNGITVSAKLTIEPGTIIKFNSFETIGSIQLLSGGEIVATGTEAAPIVFTSDRDDTYGNDITGDGNATSPKKGDWNLINTNGESESKFKYCIFQYGGGNSDPGGVLIIASGSQNTTVNHCTFRQNRSKSKFVGARAALDATGGGIGTVITNNLFEKNTLPLGVSTAFSLDNSNEFIKNKFECIQVSNATVTQQSISWECNKQPFAVNGSLSFISTTLTLSSGVIIKFIKSYYGLTLYNESNLPGYDAPGVRFTSFKDDYNSFDSNGDGFATSPHIGDWEGVRRTDGEGNWFTWSNIKYETYP